MIPDSYLVFDHDGLARGVQFENALFQIRVGRSDREWLQVYYIAKGIEPIVPAVIVPARPGDPDSVLDACVLFYPRHFQRCPSLAAVLMKLRSRTEPVRTLDFDLGGVLPEWFTLREEARPLLAELEIHACVMQKFELRRKIQA